MLTECLIIRRHTDQIEKPPEDTTTTTTTSKTEATVAPRVENGVEIYETGPKTSHVQPALKTTTEKLKPASSASVEKEPEEDDPSIPVAPNTICKRSSCGKKYVNDETNRGDGPEAECIYHPGDPVFHEGSKGNKNVK
jgi:hypothetical protein